MARLTPRRCAEISRGRMRRRTCARAHWLGSRSGSRGFWGGKGRLGLRTRNWDGKSELGIGNWAFTTMASENYFTNMMRGDAPAPPVSVHLGGRITAVDVEAGTLESAYHATPAFLNPAGQVQGGMLSAMLDDVTAILV